MKNLYLRILCLCLFSATLIRPAFGQIKPSAVTQATSLLDLDFEQAERDSMMDNLNEQKASYQALHKESIANSVPPALLFNPLPGNFSPNQDQYQIVWKLPEGVRVPARRDQLAFYTVPELAALLRDRKITSTQLTEVYIKRLKEHGDTLHCVVTLLEERAMAQARKADLELKAGLWRGPLHGIPYGVKDLLALSGHPTSWGAGGFESQMLNDTATVIQKLDKAGAVLVAKLSMGALAWGDVWFEGMTRNPWNLKQGSSGSSAGSASATAAGLVGFSIGTETWGSIVSPATRCGVTGLRPTFGRVSRSGAMALSWSMDKIGPICRSAEGCAMVFESIRGKDPKDATTRDAAFNFAQDIDLAGMKIGYVKSRFDNSSYNQSNHAKSLDILRSLGAELIPIELETKLPVYAMSIILNAEAAAAFDELTRSNRDTLLRRQIKNAWPNVFRASRFIPAVEYIQANRLRTLLIEEIHQQMQAVDVLVTPSFGQQLLITNLTGHPCVVIPNGFLEDGSPASISFLGNLFDEASILGIARAYQTADQTHRKQPPLFQAGR
ncbi:MAG: amidase [Bacteroidota bacterium]